MFKLKGLQEKKKITVKNGDFKLRYWVVWAPTMPNGKITQLVPLWGSAVWDIASGSKYESTKSSRLWWQWRIRRILSSNTELDYNKCYPNGGSVCTPNLLASFHTTGLKQQLVSFAGLALPFPLAKLPPESAGLISDNLCFCPPSSHSFLSPLSESVKQWPFRSKSFV